MDSNAISASAVRERMISERVSGLGCVAAINAGVAIRSRRMFWIAAVWGGSGGGVNKSGVYICVCALSCVTYR
jgi:hypothetical protein